MPETGRNVKGCRGFLPVFILYYHTMPAYQPSSKEHKQNNGVFFFQNHKKKHLTSEMLKWDLAGSEPLHPSRLYLRWPPALAVAGLPACTSCNEKKEASLLPLRGNRQRPILPGRVQPSTFGTGELNCCVRYGNRWALSVITTGRVSGAFYRILSFPLEKGRMTLP